MTEKFKELKEVRRDSLFLPVLHASGSRPTRICFDVRFFSYCLSSFLINISRSPIIPSKFSAYVTRRRERTPFVFLKFNPLKNGGTNDFSAPGTLWQRFPNYPTDFFRFFLSYFFPCLSHHFRLSRLKKGEFPKGRDKSFRFPLTSRVLPKRVHALLSLSDMQIIASSYSSNERDRCGRK